MGILNPDCKIANKGIITTEITESTERERGDIPIDSNKIMRAYL
jgi:hypothetical protein